jgi:hypothetical protein
MGVEGGAMVHFSTVMEFDRYAGFGSLDLLEGSPERDTMQALFGEGMFNTDPARQEEIIDEMIDLATSTWVGLEIIGTPVLFAFGPRVQATLPSYAPALGPFMAEWKYTGEE